MAVVEHDAVKQILFQEYSTQKVTGLVTHRSSNKKIIPIDIKFLHSLPSIPCNT